MLWLVGQALPLILLYRQERRQYDLTIQNHPQKSPSEIYGAEHLLRAFGESRLQLFSLGRNRFILVLAVTAGEVPIVVVVVVTRKRTCVLTAQVTSNSRLRPKVGGARAMCFGVRSTCRRSQEACSWPYFNFRSADIATDTCWTTHLHLPRSPRAKVKTSFGGTYSVLLRPLPSSLLGASCVVKRPLSMYILRSILSIYKPYMKRGGIGEMYYLIS